MTPTLYIGSNGHVAALNADDGRQIWRTKLPIGVLGTAYQDVCVLEHEGRVYAGCHGYVFCLDAATGGVLWQNDLTGLLHNDVTLSIGGKTVQFVSSHTHTHT
jgi:outer membrane protein assembly factor BamB